MKAADVMADRVISVRPDATVEEAVRLMLQDGLSGLPVVDGAGDLVGIVTEGDFLRRAETGTERHRPRWLALLLSPGRLAAEYARTHARRIEDVMTRDVVSVTPEMPLAEVAERMERRRVKRVPVVRGRKVIGVVSRADLLRALLRRVDGAPTADDDVRIRARILEELDREPWAPRACIDVAVRDGTVELRGAIMDERERAALRAVAENVRGVKAVRDRLAWVEPMSGTVIEAPDERFGDAVPSGRMPDPTAG